MTLPQDLTDPLDGPAKDLAAALDARIDALEADTNTELVARIVALEESMLASEDVNAETSAMTDYAVALATRIGQSSSSAERAAFYQHMATAAGNFQYQAP